MASSRSPGQATIRCMFRRPPRVMPSWGSAGAARGQVELALGVISRGQEAGCSLASGQ